MRFKPPPVNSDIGWRVEFRPTEVLDQLLLFFASHGYFSSSATNDWFRECGIGHVYRAVDASDHDLQSKSAHSDFSGENKPWKEHLDSVDLGRREYAIRSTTGRASASEVSFSEISFHKSVPISRNSEKYAQRFHLAQTPQTSCLASLQNSPRQETDDQSEHRLMTINEIINGSVSFVSPRLSLPFVYSRMTSLVLW